MELKVCMASVFGKTLGGAGGSSRFNRFEVGDNSRIRFSSNMWLWCGDKALEVVYTGVFHFAHCEETLVADY